MKDVKISATSINVLNAVLRVRDSVGNVMVTFRVMPEGTETDLEKIKEKLLKLGSKKVRTEPLAFGLNAVIAYFVVPDAEGGTENLEKSVRNIEGVSEAEVIELNRMLF